MPNEYVNHVVINGVTKVDLRSDTVTADKLAQGYTAHDASGSPIVGTMSGGGTEAGTVTQDADGYLVLDDDPGSSVTVEALSVTSNGTYTAPTGKAYSPVTVNVSGGDTPSGGNIADPIRFFDYDGTLVASYTSVPSALPSVPTHDNLKNGTWNYTLAQITTQFNAMGTCDVGANYMTVSEATEIDIVLQEGRLHPYLSLAVNGTVSIDWGDGSTPDTSTGTSLTTRKSDINHEYAQAGSYTIKISKTSGTGYSLYCTTTNTLLNKNSSTANANRTYSNAVQSVRVGADCAIGNNAFYYCYSLASVSMPSSITSIGDSAFNSCYALTAISIPSSVTSIGTNTFTNCALMSVSIPNGVTSISNSMFNGCRLLTSISIPNGVTSIGSSAFYNCYAFESIKIPSDVTSIGGSAFYSCYALASIEMPSSVTSIGSNTFYSCYALASIEMPSSVTSIGNGAFNSCYGMAEYHFTRTESVPTLGTTAFSNIQSDCVIYVPSSKLNDYKTAENWSTYADYMVGE